MILYKITAES